MSPTCRKVSQAKKPNKGRTLKEKVYLELDAFAPEAKFPLSQRSRCFRFPARQSRYSSRKSRFSCQAQLPTGVHRCWAVNSEEGIVCLSKHPSSLHKLKGTEICREGKATFDLVYISSTSGGVTGLVPV